MPTQAKTNQKNKPAQGNKQANQQANQQATLSVRQAFNMAVKQLRAGELAPAYRLCQQILHADPMFTDALHLKGVIAMQAGHIKEAIETLEKVRVLRPQDASVYSDLGMIRQGLRQYDKARVLLERAIELDPKSAGAHINLGNVYVALGQSDVAEQHYRQAVRIEPKMTAAHNNIARNALIDGRAREAEKHARKAIQIAPKNANAHSHLGEALDRLGRIDEAIAEHEKAVLLAPDVESLRLAYAATLAAYGRIADAQEHCRQVLARNPNAIEAMSRLSRLIKFSPDEPLLGQLTEAEKRDDLPEMERALVRFALGKAHEDMKDYQTAFTKFVEANALVAKGLAYQPEQTDRLVDEMISSMTPERLASLAKSGDPDPAPVFVVGMPRSGTSLVEQILSSHPDIAGVGELSAIRRLFKAVRTAQPDKALGDALQTIPGPKLRELGAMYVSQIRALSRDARRIVDKMPENAMFVGLIRVLLPNAKIIHARRNPTDTCLSIFKNQFVQGSLPYAYDLEHLGHFYRRYQDVMNHWNAVLPGQILEVDYEELVNDQEGQSRRMIEFCGLEWMPEVLDFHKTDRPVHTASIAQVRQPIYKGSVNIGARYGDAIVPLLNALKGDPARP